MIYKTRILTYASTSFTPSQTSFSGMCEQLSNYSSGTVRESHPSSGDKKLSDFIYFYEITISSFCANVNTVTHSLFLVLSLFCQYVTLQIHTTLSARSIVVTQTFSAVSISCDDDVAESPTDLIFGAMLILVTGLLSILFM